MNIFSCCVARTKNIHDPIDLSNISQVITDSVSDISNTNIFNVYISNVDMSNADISNMDYLNGNNSVTDNLSEITLSTIDISSVDFEIKMPEMDNNLYTIHESIENIVNIVENSNKLACEFEEDKKKTKLN